MVKDLVGDVWETFLWSINDEETVQWPTYVAMKLPHSGEVLIEQTNTDTAENECAHVEREIVRRLREELTEANSSESCSVDMFYSTYTTCVDCVQWLSRFIHEMGESNCVVAINVKITNVTRADRLERVRQSTAYWRNGSASVKQASLLLQTFESSSDFTEVMSLMKKYAKAAGQQESLEMNFPRMEYVVEKCKHTYEKIRSLLEDRPYPAPWKAKKTKSICKDNNQPVSLDTAETVIKVHPLMTKICAELNWREDDCSQERCDLYWLPEPIEDFERYFGDCAVNRVPQLEPIRNKANLARALDSHLILFPQDYTFYPKTWCLPTQYQQFCAEVACDRQAHQNSDCFIVKPDDTDKGEGIYLIKNPEDYVHETNISHVVQNYVQRPILLNKIKFDFRLYVVLFSSNLSGTQMYMSSEGIARFCAMPYEEATTENIHTPFIHTTNYATNTYSDSYAHTDDMATGSLRTATNAIRQLSEQGYDTSELWSDIEHMVVKTMMVMLPELQIAFDNALKPGNNLTCFQVMGFDVILVEEDKLKPILLEVNEGANIDELNTKQFLPGRFRLFYDVTKGYINHKIVKESLQIASDKLGRRYGTVKNGDGENEDSTSNTSPFLYELFPGDQVKSLEKYRIFERLATLFQATLGTDDTHMSAACFRRFIKKCCLADFSSSLDTTVIDELCTEHLVKDKGGHGEEDSSR